MRVERTIAFRRLLPSADAIRQSTAWSHGRLVPDAASDKAGLSVELGRSQKNDDLPHGQLRVLNFSATCSYIEPGTPSEWATTASSPAPKITHNVSTSVTSRTISAASAMA